MGVYVRKQISEPERQNNVNENSIRKNPKSENHNKFYLTNFLSPSTAHFLIQFIYVME